MKSIKTDMSSTSYLLKKLLQDSNFILKKQQNCLKNKNKLLKKLQNRSERKGSNCSKEGSKYERRVWKITTNVKIAGKDIIFNTQNKDELAGSSSKNDIECNYKNYKDTPIEIKKKNTPDWMQCGFLYNEVVNEWQPKVRSKIPSECKGFFNNLLKGKILFNGKIPPFLNKDLTHTEWKKIKSKTNDYKDNYFDIPNNTISKLYKLKGCYYIQISEKGLYHLGNDVCSFGVPEFLCPQQIRVRTKIHSRENKKGFCSLSVTAACQPEDINKLQNSPYSLDDYSRIPKNLKYIENPI